MLSIVASPNLGQSYPSTDSSSGAPVDRIFEAFQNNPAACLLDSSSIYVDAIEPDWWAARVDSSTTVSPLEVDIPKEQVPDPTMPTEDQIVLVVHTLGFSKRQLAELFGVSRQAIYDWFEGRNISDENASRLSELARLLLEATPDTRRPLYHRFTTQPLTEKEPSILDLLRAKSWDTDRLLTQLRRARDLTTQRLTRQVIGQNRVSRKQGDENLMDNLLSLGEE